MVRKRPILCIMYFMRSLNMLRVPLGCKSWVKKLYRSQTLTIWILKCPRSLASVLLSVDCVVFCRKGGVFYGYLQEL